MKRPAFRFVTVDEALAGSAAASESCRCPHVHPGSHRLHECHSRPRDYQCGCRRVYSPVQVVELSRQMAMIELSFDCIANVIERDPHGFRANELLVLIEGVFDAIQFLADDFGVWL